ncbi:MAG: TIGR03905 family TSCPD domain-containing protein [Negativicutes bacterium]|nr:TIGR03905 family TSCPD domain-containing protein [Negativicutes bacterium]
MIRYTTEGVCSKAIHLEVEAGKVKSVEFIEGCPGNLKAIAKLVEGLPVEEVIEKLQGNVCPRSKNESSCADQLARALKKSLQ